MPGQPADQGGDRPWVVAETVAGTGHRAEVGVAEAGLEQGPGVGDGDDLVGLAVDQEQRAGGDPGGGLQRGELGEAAAPGGRVGREVGVAMMPSARESARSRSGWNAHSENEAGAASVATPRIRSSLAPRMIDSEPPVLDPASHTPPTSARSDLTSTA